MGSLVIGWLAASALHFTDLKTHLVSFQPARVLVILPVLLVSRFILTLTVYTSRIGPSMQNPDETEGNAEHVSWERVAVAVRPLCAGLAGACLLVLSLCRTDSSQVVRGFLRPGSSLVSLPHLALLLSPVLAHYLSLLAGPGHGRAYTSSDLAKLFIFGLIAVHILGRLMQDNVVPLFEKAFRYL